MLTILNVFCFNTITSAETLEEAKKMHPNANFNVNTYNGSYTYSYDHNNLSKPQQKAEPITNNINRQTQHFPENNYAKKSEFHLKNEAGNQHTLPSVPINIDLLYDELTLSEFNDHAKTIDGKPLAMDNGKIIPNPYFTNKNNLYTPGQCTFYVFNKRAEVFVHCDDHDIVFNSSIIMSADSLGYKGSARAKGESDDLSTQIGKVVSGFDYKANKKEYDELYQYFKDNQKKYDYYGYTKEAINKTQNSGYQNEFFWISGYPIDLAQYDKYYKPLIQMNQKEFSEKYRSMKYTTNGGFKKAYVVTTFFDTNDNFNRKKEVMKLLDIAHDIQNDKLGPDKSEVEYTLTYTSNEITTYDGTQNGNNRTSYGVYDEE